MLRILFAAIAGSLVLRLWALVSAALLPWPVVVVGPLQPPTVAAVSPALPQTVPEQIAVQDQALQHPELGVEPPPLPVRSYHRLSALRVSSFETVHHVAADLGVAMLAALAALVIPPNTPWPRQAAIVVLGASFAALLCNLSQAARLDWTPDYVLVQCVDHFVSMVLVASVVIVIVRVIPPVGRQQTAKPLSIDGR